MYVGITHETAPASIRCHYALSGSDKQEFIQLLKIEMQIRALTVITTCNRTEIYFESESITPYEVRDYFILFLENKYGISLNRKHLVIFDRSVDTLNHLLHVANGLRSAVIGDKQIISQVKQAYQDALASHSQGSLLERAYQAVFRSHKRILSESLYQKGSTSTAYSSLKMAQSFFGKEELSNTSLLVIGAGEIAEDILMYASKFQISNVYIANRTEIKAQQLADKYQCSTYPWKKVEANHFSSFDIIVTAVSNRKNLIKTTDQDGKRRLWLDLAMPSNISTEISNTYNTVYDIDEIAKKMTAVSQAQLKAIPQVEAIITQELTTFSNWLQKAKVRSFLKAYKSHTKKIFREMAPSELKQESNAELFEQYIELAANKLVKRSAQELNYLTSGELSQHQFNILHNAFGI